MNKIYKCEICGEDAGFGNSRCKKCNHIWQMGYEFGYELGKNEIRALLRDALGISMGD